MLISGVPRRLTSPDVTLQVSWARAGGPALDPTHHKESNDGDMYSISIDQVVDSDMGIYTCRAKSALGTAVAPIGVTGQREGAPGGDARWGPNEIGRRRAVS